MTEQTHRHSLVNSEFLRRLAGVQGFSDSPRWKRHSSLDAGVFRARIAPFLPYNDSEISPISYQSSPDDEKRFSNDFPSARSSIFAHSAFAPAPFTLKSEKRAPTFWAWIAGLSATLLLIGFWTGWSGRPLESQLWAAKDLLEDYGLAIPLLHSTLLGPCDNPYHEYGHLAVDQHDPERNQWIPYDPTCTPPQNMATLRTMAPKLAPKLDLPTPPRSNAPTRDLPLPWLYGKTVLLFGDHVERYHSKDVCNFVGGVFEIIDAKHPLSPPRFRNGIDERHERRNETARSGRPTVCYLEQYDFMIVTVFHFGLANRVEFEHEHLFRDKHFYPPVAVQDRLSHIVEPLLISLNRTEPDLIEFSSGLWDLRHFTALDEKAGKDLLSELSTERLEWYSDRLSQSLLDVGAMFPGVPLLWRALHQPPRHRSAAFSRVAALDHLGRKIVANLNNARRRRGSSHFDLPPLVSNRLGQRVESNERSSTHAPFLARVRQRIGLPKTHVEDQKSYRPSSPRDIGMGLIRIDEWGALMLGQEHLMKGLHTPALPGGYIWGDIMLFELEKASRSTNA